MLAVLVWVQGLSFGQKDVTTSAFKLWEDLLFTRRSNGFSPFHLPSASTSSAAGSGGGSAQSRRLAGLCAAAHDFGDSELLLAGVAENLLSCRYLDINMAKTSKMLDTLQQADMLMRACRRSGEFSLMAYIPPLLVSIHTVAATHERVQLQWPKSGAAANRAKASTVELLHDWSSKLAANVARSHDGRSLVLEVVPCLKKLVCPTVRAVAQHLLLPIEKASLAHTVSVMVGYGISYSFDDPSKQLQPWQQQAAASAAAAGGADGDGAALVPPPRLVPLVPALDTLHMYCGLPPSVKPIPLVVRQMLSQLVINEGIRRAEAARTQLAANDSAGAESSPSPGGKEAGGRAGGRASSSGSTPGSATAARKEMAQRSALLSGASKSGAGAAAVVEVKPAHWLDALRIAGTKRKAAARGGGGHAAAADGPAGGMGGKLGSDGKTTFPVLYRFNEGYTNAVKRPLTMQELLHVPASKV